MAMRIFRSYPNHPSPPNANNFGGKASIPLIHPNLKEALKSGSLVDIRDYLRKRFLTKNVIRKKADKTSKYVNNNNYWQAIFYKYVLIITTFVDM